MTPDPWPVRLAVALARGWARVYTVGIPGQTAQDRRDEIDSDLWESLRDAAAGNRAATAAAVQVVLRTVCGLADDIAWRLDEPAVRRRATWQAVGVIATLGTAAALWMVPVMRRARLPLPPPPAAIRDAAGAPQRLSLPEPDVPGFGRPTTPG